MFETVDKIMSAGLGVLSMSRERAEKIFDELVSRGQAQRADRKTFVRDLTDRAKKTREDFTRLVDEGIDKAVAKLDLAKRSDIERLEKKLNNLLKRK